MPRTSVGLADATSCPTYLAPYLRGGTAEAWRISPDGSWAGKAATVRLVQGVALWIPAWTVVGVLVGEMVRRRGRDPWIWFVVIVALGIFGLIICGFLWS